MLRDTDVDTKEAEVKKLIEDIHRRRITLAVDEEDKGSVAKNQQRQDKHLDELKGDLFPGHRDEVTTPLKTPLIAEHPIRSGNIWDVLPDSSPPATESESAFLGDKSTNPIASPSSVEADEQMGTRMAHTSDPILRFEAEVEQGQEETQSHTLLQNFRSILIRRAKNDAGGSSSAVRIERLAEAEASSIL